MKKTVQEIEREVRKEMRGIIDQAIQDARKKKPWAYIRQAWKSTATYLKPKKQPMDWTKRKPHMPSKILWKAGEKGLGFVLPYNFFQIANHVLSLTEKTQEAGRKKKLKEQARIYAFDLDDQIKENWSLEDKKEYTIKIGFNRLEELMASLRQAGSEIPKDTNVKDMNQWKEKVYTAAWVGYHLFRLKRELSILASIVDEYNNVIEPNVRNLAVCLKKLQEIGTEFRFDGAVQQNQLDW